MCESTPTTTCRYNEPGYLAFDLIHSIDGRAERALEQAGGGGYRVGTHGSSRFLLSVLILSVFLGSSQIVESKEEHRHYNPFYFQS